MRKGGALRKFIIIIAVTVAALFASPALAWEAKVVRVSDGDTVVLERLETGEIIRVRLYGVDAPEGRGRNWEPQPYSRIAANFLKDLLPVGARCGVMDMGYDKYSRTVGGVVSLPDGKIAQEELLRAGLAWVYPKYCPDCRQWKELQKEAREGKRGLWKENNPVPPWKWRKGMK